MEDESTVTDYIWRTTFVLTTWAVETLPQTSPTIILTQTTEMKRYLPEDPRIEPRFMAAKGKHYPGFYCSEPLENPEVYRQVPWFYMNAVLDGNILPRCAHDGFFHMGSQQIRCGVNLGVTSTVIATMIQAWSRSSSERCTFLFR